MSIEQYKNDSFKILGKYFPDYVIPFSYFENNDIKFENILFIFYSVVNNINYFNAIFYYSANFEKNLNSQDILNKDFCGFSPNEVIIFNISKEKAVELIKELKSTRMYKNNYSECL